MDYYYYNPDNIDLNKEISKSNNYQNNLDIIQNDDNMKNLIGEHFKKYLINKSPKIQYKLEIDSSKEGINSKEDVIKTNNDGEIQHLGTGKFRFIANQSEQNNINKNEKEKELNYDKNNITEQKEIKEFQDNNKNNDKPNQSSKITNNICIIINKPEVKENHIDEEDNNKNISFEYLNTFGNEEEENKDNSNKNNIKIDKNLKYQKSQKNSKKRINTPIVVKLKHKKNNSYVDNPNIKFNFTLGENNLNNNFNFSNIESESVDEENKETLHKKSNQKQMKDFERKIDQKTFEIKDKKNIIDKRENIHIRSSTSGNEDEKNFYGNQYGLKEGFTNKDSDLYLNEQKNRQNLINNYNKKDNYNNLDNKSIGSEDKYFNDFRITSPQINKYTDLEQKIYRTMSPNLSIDKLNISFNQSIEQKRKLLGIPLNQNDFQIMNKKIEEDLNKEEKEKSLIQKLSLYKKRHDELIKIYERKNIINQKSRENIINLTKKKHNSYKRDNNKVIFKQKNPIRIIYQDKYSKSAFLNNIENENDSNINDNNIIKLGNELRIKNINYNNSYSGKKKNIKKNNYRISNSQENIYDYKRKKNINHNKFQNNDYINKKIKIYRNKDWLKGDKIFVTKNNNRKSKEQNELKKSSKINDNQKEKKIYENKSFYSKFLSKLFRYNDKSSSQNNKKASTKTLINKNLDNYNTNIKNPDTTYNNNLMTDISRNSKTNINSTNNNNEITSPNRYKGIYSPPRTDEIISIQDNENVKTIHIIKKRNKSPKNSQKHLPVNESQIQKKIQTHNKIVEFKIQDNLKEKKIEKNVDKKEYKGSIIGPGRGISALRRINQKIENYRKKIFSKKKKKPKVKNPQFKSTSELKQKFGKQIFGRVKQSNSIRTLPDVNKNTFKNFDNIDDL